MLINTKKGIILSLYIYNSGQAVPTLTVKRMLLCCKAVAKRIKTIKQIFLDKFCTFILVSITMEC